MQRATCDANGYITVRGWACDPKSANSTIPVHFYADTLTSDNLIGHVIADIDMKQDAIKGECGGTSNHRFNEKQMLQPVTNRIGPVADKWRDGRQHRLTAIGLSVDRKSDSVIGLLDANSLYFTCPFPSGNQNTNPNLSNIDTTGNASQNTGNNGALPITVTSTAECGTSHGKVLTEKPTS